MEKLQSKMLFVDVIVALFCGLVVLPAGAQEIAPGFDLYAGNAGPCWVQANTDSMISAIPPDFFFPGSQPWTGIIELTGDPQPNYCEPIHMVIQRTERAPMPGPATIPIELVALSLKSVEPITVTDGAGGEPHYYDVNMTVSPYVPSDGNMVIEQTMVNTGGKFCYNDSPGSGIMLYLQFSFFEAWPSAMGAASSGDPLEWMPPDPVKLKTDKHYGWQTAAPLDACLLDNGYYPAPGQHILMLLDDGNSGEITVIPQGTGPGWHPGDPYKMHYPQLPDPCGWDVDFSDEPADDWLCTETGPVSDIHFWISWQDDMVGRIDWIDVRIYSDDPCDYPGDFSKPNEPANEPLWDQTFYPGQFNISWAGEGDQGWFYPDPFIGWGIRPDHNDYYRIDIKDINDPFIQHEGAIYWLNVHLEASFWPGWKTSLDHWNDNAVFWAPFPFDEWRELYDPCTGERLDFAFVITSEVAEPNMDYGDAPDPPYPTLLASDGARHSIVAGMHLGTSVDDEPDGQPDANALGDDNDGNDDEDGVWFINPLVPGQWVAVDVEASWDGALDAWIDFGDDGSWAEPVDQIFVAEPLLAGLNTLWFQVPFGAKQNAITYARFRFSSMGFLPYDGPAPDGEVEDYEVYIEEEPMIKWVQPPDLSPNGIDIKVDGGMWLADDFECTSYGPITDVHLYGSWKDDQVGEIMQIHLSIHSDDPVGPGGRDPCNLYSQPDVLLWEQDFSRGAWDEALIRDLLQFGQGGEYWWDPVSGELIPNGDYQIWRIDIYIDPCDVFIQDGDPCHPVIYWLDVQVDTMFGEFGWKTRRFGEQYMDDAVWDFGSELPRIWTELRYPFGHLYYDESIDMAFVITGEQWQRAKEPVPNLKWSQPPIEIDPTSTRPEYCGWNEESHREIISFDCWGPDWPCQCRGDADNDWSVGIPDLFALKAAWGSSYPEPAYNACADFDRNLVVDHRDLEIVKGIGLPCPGPGACPEWTGSIPTTGQVEYYDLFAVSLSSDDVYWNLVNGGGGMYSDPLLSPDPAGNPIIATGPNTPLGDVVWGFGGLDWGDGSLDSDAAAHSIESMGAANYYLSVILDTATSPQADGYVPSWGTISDIVVRAWTGTGWGPPEDIQNWSISPYDPDGGTGVTGGTSSMVTLAANDFGEQETDEQNGTGIWGAAVQLPDANGYRVEFTTDVHTWDSYDDEGPEARVAWQTVADDFRCLGPMPIKSVHWWGSHLGWIGQELPPVAPEGWHIGFWSNVPANPAAGPPYSHPGKLLWQVEVPAERVQVEYVGDDYFPEKPFGLESCFQYYLDFDASAVRDERFWQYKYRDETTDDIFWISITALYPYGSPPVNHPWGWKTRPASWMDDAVTISLPQEPNESTVLNSGSVTPLEYEMESYDACFELDTQPYWIKWEQPFTGIRNWPHYEDEESMATVEPTGELNVNRLVADDWRCDHNAFLTSVVWWGSYIGYSYEACQGPAMAAPPVKPDFFWLTIWDDVPAGADLAYSHPNDIIWEYRAYDYDEVMVGYDKHPEGQPNEPVFRYSVRVDHNELFRQDTNEGIYWLGVVAVYDQNIPNFPWGWTNHEHFYNDDAVAGILDLAGPEPKWLWAELYDQTSQSEDMSFMLFEDPNAYTCWDPLECKGQPSGDATCNGRIDLADLFALKQYFGKRAPWTAPECCADFTQDGRINLADLFALKAGFGAVGHAPSTGNQNCP